MYFLKLPCIRKSIRRIPKTMGQGWGGINSRVFLAMCKALIGQHATPCKVRHKKGYGPGEIFCQKHATIIELGVQWENGTYQFKPSVFYVYLNWKKQIKSEERIREIACPILARRIQLAWRNAISNPSYKLCRDRLTREFNSEDPI